MKNKRLDTIMETGRLPTLDMPVLNTDGTFDYENMVPPSKLHKQVKRHLRRRLTYALSRSFLQVKPRDTFHKPFVIMALGFFIGNLFRFYSQYE